MFVHMLSFQRSSLFIKLIVFPVASTHWYKNLLAIGIIDLFCKLLFTFGFILSHSNFFSNPKLSIVFEEFTSHL
jgi:hypothetical protein